MALQSSTSPLFPLIATHFKWIGVPNRCQGNRLAAAGLLKYSQPQAISAMCHHHQQQKFHQRRKEIESRNDGKRHWLTFKGCLLSFISIFTCEFLEPTLLTLSVPNSTRLCRNSEPIINSLAVSLSCDDMSLVSISRWYYRVRLDERLTVVWRKTMCAPFMATRIVVVPPPNHPSSRRWHSRSSRQGWRVSKNWTTFD